MSRTGVGAVWCESGGQLAMTGWVPLHRSASVPASGSCVDRGVGTGFALLVGHPWVSRSLAVLMVRTRRLEAPVGMRATLPGPAQ
jgi:hypothetical protein